ncbi:hypothetical protein ACOI1H_14770 [Loktanella sp. DJP18]|uniref:hypothetical protein n=1 Tax=Loktanella sp. DJP18 TaxID=3409788 RepID=UPI003BB6FE69
MTDEPLKAFDPEPLCKTCRFRGLTWQSLICRRFPPQIVVVDGKTTSEFPQVNHDMFCAEYQPDNS